MSVTVIPAREIERLSLPRRIALSSEILRIYARMRWLLLRRGLKPTVAALRSTGAAPDGCDRNIALVRGHRLGHATIRVLRVLPTDGRCLMRSLVLTGLLARRGLPTSLVIGVDPGPDFAAHAWVEYDGVALLQAGDYHRLLEL